MEPGGEGAGYAVIAESAPGMIGMGQLAEHRHGGPGVRLENGAEQHVLAVALMESQDADAASRLFGGACRRAGGVGVKEVRSPLGMEH